MKHTVGGLSFILLLASSIIGKQVPNVAWGDDGKTLYMTAGTSVYRVRLNVGGKQPCC